MAGSPSTGSVTRNLEESGGHRSALIPKLDVAGSSPVARSQYANDLHAVGISDSDGVVIS